jgi:alanine racemase
MARAAGAWPRWSALLAERSTDAGWSPSSAAGNNGGRCPVCRGSPRAQAGVPRRRGPARHTGPVHPGRDATLSGGGGALLDARSGRTVTGPSGAGARDRPMSSSTGSPASVGAPGCRRGARLGGADPRGAYVVAVDLPSGHRPGGAGRHAADCVFADETVTFGAPKPVPPTCRPPRRPWGADRRRHRPGLRRTAGAGLVERLTHDDVRPLWPVPGPGVTSTPAGCSASWPARRHTRGRPCSRCSVRWAPARDGALPRARRRARPRARQRSGGVTATGRVQAWVLGSGVDPEDPDDRGPASSSSRALESDQPCRRRCRRPGGRGTAAGAHAAHATCGGAGSRCSPDSPVSAIEVTRDEVLARPLEHRRRRPPTRWAQLCCSKERRRSSCRQAALGARSEARPTHPRGWRPPGQVTCWPASSAPCWRPDSGPGRRGLARRARPRGGCRPGASRWPGPSSDPRSPPSWRNIASLLHRIRRRAPRQTGGRWHQSSDDLHTTNRASPGSPATAYVDLGAIDGERAGRCAARAPSSALMAVVKADAYGHGLAAGGPGGRGGRGDLARRGAADEAIALRDNGIHGRVSSPGSTSPAPTSPVPSDGTSTSSASAPWQLTEIAAAAHSLGSHRSPRPPQGRHRPGTATGPSGRGLHRAARPARRTLTERQGTVKIVGVWSHFAYADQPDHHRRCATSRRSSRPRSGRQRRAGCVSGGPPSGQFRCHADQSERCTTTWSGSGSGDLRPVARCPNSVTHTAYGLTPAMTLTARFALVKGLPAGQGVSYAHSSTSQPPTTRVGLIPMGYADGIPRMRSARRAARGRRPALSGGRPGLHGPDPRRPRADSPAAGGRRGGALRDGRCRRTHSAGLGVCRRHHLV